MQWESFSFRRLSKWIVGFFLAGFLSIAVIYVIAFLLGPPDLKQSESTVYYGADGNIIGEESTAERRYWLELEEIPDDIIEATIAIEDERFYKHHGFDIKRILKAALIDMKNMSLKEGASTLTQQYARNLYLNHEKSWSRKLKEAFYTIRLEMFNSKDELMEGYLNTIYYGHGAYGIEAASRQYFDKTAAELTLAESAMLAGIPKGPAYYSPFHDRDNANQRQKKVLAHMQEEGDITKDECELAVQENITYTEIEEQKKNALAPYFQDMALEEASNLLELSKEDIRQGGYDIYTTLNPSMQKKLEEQAGDTIEPESDIEIGAIAMRPEDGAIEAVMGGRSYEKSPFNRALQAERLAGSTFKPFLYYAALEEGYTASTRLMSAPTEFRLDDGQVYQPSNYNGYYAEEPITLATALALSDNMYAVKTNMQLGTDRLIQSAEQFGIQSDLPDVPSLALGSGSVTPNEMAKSYSMLANGGYRAETHTVREIVDRNGKTLYQHAASPEKRVLDPQAAFILTDLMTGMFDHTMDGYMQVTGSSIADELTRNYAGKSGTTDSDSWMIGFSPQLTTAIWTGYDDNRAMDKVQEKSYAKDIWAGFMEAAHSSLPKEGFTVPEGVNGIPVDPDSGKRAGPGCPESRIMYYRMGNEPEGVCEEHTPGQHDRYKTEIESEGDGKSVFQEIFDMFF